MSDEQEFLLDDQVSEHFDRVFGDAGGGDDEPVDEPIDDEFVEDEVLDDEPVEDDSVDEPAVDDPYLFAGQHFDRQDIEQLVTWASSLTPDQMQRINDALVGQPEPQVQADTQGLFEDTPADFGLDPDDALDPDLAKYVLGLSAEVEQLRQAQAMQFEQEQERERELLESAFESARSGVGERLGLSDSDLEALVNRTNQSGIVTYLAQQQGLGAPESLFTQALESTYWMTPEFREKSLSRQAEVAATEQRDLDAKKARAASGGASRGSAARTRQEPQTQEERFNAMVAEIAQEIGR
jgi:hypothetical protein